MSRERKPGERAHRRWFANPAFSVAIFVSWLLLQQSVALPQLISAVAFGLGLPWLIDGFLDLVVRPSKPLVALRLVGVVIRDVVESNLSVARLALSPWAKPRPAWLRVQMEIRHPLGQVLLASIITNTPGTVTCKIDEDANEIIVHVLDCDDAQAIIELIKQRYERPLMEILE